MKICAAQTGPIKGDIQHNIDNHKPLIDLTISNGADTVIFPDLSLTGYELELSKELETNQDTVCNAQILHRIYSIFILEHYHPF